MFRSHKTLRMNFVLKQKEWYSPCITSAALTFLSRPLLFVLQAMDMFMSSCTVFVFLSLMEYAVVNIILGDMVDHKAPPDENLLRRVTRKLTVRRPGTPTTRRRVRHLQVFALTLLQINDLQNISETSFFDMLNMKTIKTKAISIFKDY